MADRRNVIAPKADRTIRARDCEVYVSVASVWEMAIKVGVGKWPEANDLVREFEKQTAAEGFRLLQISGAHARAAGLMQTEHRDPFDRLIVAQAQIEGLTLVTADARPAELGAACL
ncbi:MAG: type II toxin-antitoxin system VapC family toxin [Hyphomicrobium sp.]